MGGLQSPRRCYMEILQGVALCKLSLFPIPTDYTVRLEGPTDECGLTVVQLDQCVLKE